jgi:hypothetical protein
VRKKLFQILASIIFDNYFKVIILFDIKFRSYWQTIDRINGWLTKNEAFFLYKLAKMSKNSFAVEIGSYEGKSTSAIAAGYRGIVLAVDPHTGDRTEVENNLKIDTYKNFCRNVKNFENIQIQRSTSIEAAKIYRGDKISFLFIDGWHSEEEVDNDIKAWLPHCDENVTIVFDDFSNLEVQKGIIKNLHRLPPFFGIVGKDLAFSNSPKVLRSPTMQFLKIQKYRRKAKPFLKIQP